MVSALWNACSAGDADAVRALLTDATTQDLELKDHFGVTPLIEAVRNGHLEIVTALLDKGADAANPSAQGPPESYTSDPAIIELLRSKLPFAAPPAPYPYFPAPDATFFPSDAGNLPPPDIARFIPCRYFPACRYGPSCMFAHPQQYYPGSLPPPAPFVPPFDHMQYPPNYFPPPPFQPNAVVSPPPDIPSPFSPNGLPAPYGPMSPNAYPHTGQTPVPMLMSPLPPPNPAPIYPSPPAPSYVHDPSAPYPGKPNMPPQDFNADLKTQDAPGINNHHPSSGHRRGSGRRGSFNGGRKPPCLFFPSGRCKNGDDCRWPHVSPDANAPHHVPYFSGRAPRPPRQPNNTNGIATIDEKLGNLTVRDDVPAQQNGAVETSTQASTRPQSNDTARPRYGKNNHNNFGQNGSRPEKRPPPFKQQRVPNADEFPVLAGSNTPPARTQGLNGFPNGNGHSGPTAAQVLSAPAPVRKDASSKESSTRGTSPDPVKPAASKAEPTTTATAAQDHPAPKLPISFAAVAAPELPKEIALSA